MTDLLAAHGIGALLLDGLAGGLVLVGAWFFLAGTVGLLRFPDVYTRLHALAKADALGLGFVALGLSVRAEWPVRVQLVLIWLLALASTAAVAHLLARHSLSEGVVPLGAGAEEEADP